MLFALLLTAACSDKTLSAWVAGLHKLEGAANAESSGGSFGLIVSRIPVYGCFKFVSHVAACCKTACRQVMPGRCLISLPVPVAVSLEHPACVGTRVATACQCCLALLSASPLSPSPFPPSPVPHFPFPLSPFPFPLSPFPSPSPLPFPPSPLPLPPCPFPLRPFPHPLSPTPTPSLVSGASGKLAVLSRLLESMLSAGQRCVVVSTSTAALNLIQDTICNEKG